MLGENGSSLAQTSFPWPVAKHLYQLGIGDKASIDLEQLRCSVNRFLQIWRNVKGRTPVVKIEILKNRNRT